MTTKKKKRSRVVVEVRSEAEGIYQRELVRCGKHDCGRCKRRPVHGPYWYLYQWQPARGKRLARLRSTYIGKGFERRVA